MSSQPGSQPPVVETDEDLVKSKRAAANVGKRFYTWATLGTFSGAAFLAGGLWTLVKRVGVKNAEGEGWPLLFSFLIVIAFAFASEPEYRTKRHQKVQKAILTLGNGLLLYFIVVGGCSTLQGA